MLGGETATEGTGSVSRHGGNALRMRLLIAKDTELVYTGVNGQRRTAETLTRILLIHVQLGGYTRPQLACMMTRSWLYDDERFARKMAKGKEGRRWGREIEYERFS